MEQLGSNNSWTIFESKIATSLLLSYSLTSQKIVKASTGPYKNQGFNHCIFFENAPLSIAYLQLPMTYGG